MRPADFKPNRLDRMIMRVAPGWGAKRLYWKARAAAVMAYYDGATTGRRGASIRRSSADPNVISRTSLPKLRAGSHDLIRNDPHARRAVEAIVSNTVGAGIVPQFTRDGKRAEDIEELAKRSLHTTEVDSDGLLPFGGLQGLALHTTVEGGECLVRRRWRRSRDGLAVPVQFQHLDGEYLDHAKDGPVRGGGRIVQGVEFDRLGRRRAYWLFPEHPGGSYYRGQSQPVPARDVAHLYRPERPGQVRGIPWAAVVMLAHADFGDTQDAQRMKQKVAACFAGFYVENFDSTLPGSAREENDQLIDTIEPGTMERLPPGSEVKFADPPSVDGYGEFANVTLHQLAMGWGVSYEAMTGDLRGVNFSSGKMGRLEFQRNIGRWQHSMLMPMYCSPLVGWWLEAAELVGADTRGVKAGWVTPRNEMVDPPKEMRAEADAIRSGQKTWSQSIRESGRDPETHFEEYAEDLKRFDRLGITVSTDARDKDEPESGSGGSEAELEEVLGEIRDMLERARR